jgi:upstream activation factor subunit UAF30
MPADEPTVRKRAEPYIRDILTSPGVDYQTITAKRIRKALVETKGLEEAWVRENKEVLDFIILEVFNEVSGVSAEADGEEDTEGGQEGSGEKGTEVPKTPTAKRKREDVLKEEERVRASAALTSPDVKIADKAKQQKKKEKEKREAVGDAQIAWQLQRDLNLSTGRTTRRSGSGRKGPGASAPGKGAKRGGKVKSKEVVEDSDEEDGSGHDGSDSRPKKKRKTTGANGETAEAKKKGGGWSKPQPLRYVDLVAPTHLCCVLMHPLQRTLSSNCWCLVHVPPTSRQEDVGAYSRQVSCHDMPLYIPGADCSLSGLQNPDNKKEIICDDKFRAMFNVNKIDMFRMNKELSK